MKVKMKKGMQYLFNTVSIVIVLIATLLLISVLFTSKGNIPNIMGYSMLRVLTESMKPEIPADSLILVNHCSVNELQTGDVISFYSMDPDLDGMVNTHRITRIEQQDGRSIIYTKGDANVVEDEYYTDEEHLIGKVVWTNQILGKGVRLISNPLVFVPIIIAPLLVILGYHLWQIIHTTKEISKQQEEEYQEALVQIIKKKKQSEKAKSEKNQSEKEQSEKSDS